MHRYLLDRVETCLERFSRRSTCQIVRFSTECGSSIADRRCYAFRVTHAIRSHCPTDYLAGWLCLSILRVRFADCHQLSCAHRIHLSWRVVCVLSARLLFHRRPALAVRRVQHRSHPGSCTTDLAREGFSKGSVSTP